MKLKMILLFGLALFTTIHAAVLTPDQVLKLLQEGNTHFKTGKMTHKFYVEEAKNSLLDQQTPIAVIVGCSDSRVPPELIFDKGLGELFVVRIAGNVIGPIEMDSVEYAAKGLAVPLIVVLGHQQCGAVKAALAGQENYPELETIIPIIDSALEDCDVAGEQGLKHAIVCNVKNSVATLKNSPTLAPLLKSGKLKIVGAYYEIATGQVAIIGG